MLSILCFAYSPFSSRRICVNQCVDLAARRQTILDQRKACFESGMIRSWQLSFIGVLVHGAHGVMYHNVDTHCVLPN